MELGTRIVRGKAPRDGAQLRIALRLQRGNALAQILHAFHATRQTATGKNTDLDFGHVQPTAMFGRVVELDSLQDAPGLGWLKGLVKGRGRMSIEVILHDTNIFGLRIDRIYQPSDAVGVVDLGAMLRHLDMTPASGGVDEEKQVGRAQPLILVIYPLWLSRLYRLWGPHVRLGCDEFFVKADARVAWVVLFFVEVQHILHRRDKLRSY